MEKGAEGGIWEFVLKEKKIKPFQVIQKHIYAQELLFMLSEFPSVRYKDISFSSRPEKYVWEVLYGGITDTSNIRGATETSLICSDLLSSDTEFEIIKGKTLFI